MRQFDRMTTLSTVTGKGGVKYKIAKYPDVNKHQHILKCLQMVALDKSRSPLSALLHRP